jgi:small subunit ribosomal protein S6
MAAETESVIQSGLKKYELMIIVSPDGGEESCETAISRVTDYLTAKGGEVISVDRWGKKRLAYQIKQYLEGSYALVTFTMPPGAAPELEKDLEISEDVIRHLLVLLEG